MVLPFATDYNIVNQSIKRFIKINTYVMYLRSMMIIVISKQKKSLSFLPTMPEKLKRCRKKEIKKAGKSVTNEIKRLPS